MTLVEGHKPDTQSFKPAGKGATSGAVEGHIAFRKSTIATPTPLKGLGSVINSQGIMQSPEWILFWLSFLL